MASEEDNFDIDVYGDDVPENGQNQDHDGNEVDFTLEESHPEENTDHVQAESQAEPQAEPQQDVQIADTTEQTQSISSTVHSSAPPVQAPKQAPQQQGVKRKDSSSDHRPLDPGATSALLISDLQWWHTEDDLRGWANQADAEDELKDVTFSEHKVNGKSKGQAFLEFSTSQASTATKRKIDSFTAGQQNARKCTVTYTNPSINPFKTLPKDGPQRAKEVGNQRGPSGSYNSNTMNTNFNNTGASRGGRGGGFNNRGGMNNMGGGFNSNRNFSGPMGGYQQNPMGGFQGNMGGMQNFGGFNNRGGMMNNMRGGVGMRGGGRGGMNTGMIPMGNMGNMAMGGIGMNMAGNMNPMMNMGMQGGFQGGNANFNPGFFPNQAMGGDGSWNPHGAKRTRQE